MKKQKTSYPKQPIGIQLLLILFLGLASFAQAQTDFKKKDLKTNFKNGCEIQAYDINQDGYQDLLCAGDGYGKSVIWFENLHDRSFEEHNISSTFPVARSARCADFNLDGLTDVIAASVEGNMISVWQQGADFEWTEHNITDEFKGAHTVSVKDINEDGLPDFLCSGFDLEGHESDIAWWENKGNFAFEKHHISDRFQTSPFIEAADLDNDGDEDIIACGELNDEILWWENDGDEHFTEHMIDSTLNAPHTVRARDVDGDGDTDLLAAACLSSKMAWYENKGYNHFERNNLEVMPGALWLDAADMNGDGLTDMIGGGMGSPRIAIWYQKEEGGFQRSFLDDIFQGLFSLSPADIDNDGDMDLAAISYTKHTISWFMNQTTDPDYINKPESIAFDHERDRYLVSNCGGNNILAINKENKEQEIFIDDIESPLGNCICNNVLYVSSGKKVLGYSLENGSKVFEIEVDAVAHMDGMTSDADGFLYVIDTGGGIYKIDPNNSSCECIVNSGLAQYVQDCIYDPFNNRLLSVSWSPAAPVQAIDLGTYELTTATETTFGYYDGIAMDQYGNVFLASHGGTGRIIKYVADFSDYEIVSTGHDEAAGLDYNPWDNVLAIPNFGGHCIDFIEFSTTGTGYLNKKNEHLNIMPNPSNGRFSINCSDECSGKAYVDILNSRGAAIISAYPLERFEKDKWAEMNLSHLPKGTYILSIRNKKEKYSKKLIIQ